MSEQPDEQLRQYLEARDVSCPGCGYNLRDLQTGRCPECGQGLELSIRLVEPRQTALITGLVGLAAGAGLGGLLLIYGIIVIATRAGPNTREMMRFFFINAVGFAGHVVPLVFWLKHWNDIRRFSSGNRRLLVIGCCALPFMFVVIFAVCIR